MTLLERTTEVDKEGKITAGVFLPIPAQIAKHFPNKDAHDDSPPHLTLLYLGDITAEQQVKALYRIKQVMAYVKPFRVDMTEYGEFTNPEGKTIPHMAPTATHPHGLSALHVALWRAIEDAGVPVGHSYGDYEAGKADAAAFKSHATLDYLEPGETYDGPKPTGSWDVREIEVWGHKKIKVPLGAALSEDLDVDDQALADAIVGANTTHDHQGEMWREVRTRLHGHPDGIPGRERAEARVHTESARTIALLVEVLRSPANKWAWRTPNHRATFRAGKIAYEVLFKPKARYVQIDFGILPDQSPQWVRNAVHDVGAKGIVDLKDTKPREVFATVIAIVRDYLERNEPERVDFAAVEPSRQKLYAKLVKRLAPSWGYELKGGEHKSQFILLRRAPVMADKKIPCHDRARNHSKIAGLTKAMVAANRLADVAAGARSAIGCRDKGEIQKYMGYVADAHVDIKKGINEPAAKKAIDTERLYDTPSPIQPGSSAWKAAQKKRQTAGARSEAADFPSKYGSVATGTTRTGVATAPLPDDRPEVELAGLRRRKLKTLKH